MSTPVEILHRLSVVEEKRAKLDAEQLRLLAEYQQARAPEGALAVRSVPDEVALILRTSRRHAKSQLGLARDLVERLPDTLDALSRGQIDLGKARALVGVTTYLPVDDARAVEAKVLPKASIRVLSQVRASARYHRDRIDPDAAERRRQQAKTDREVRCRSLDDNSGRLNLAGPGERVNLAWQTIDWTARKIKVSGDTRALSAIRFDVATDLILGANDERVQVHAYLHVSGDSLDGIADNPGILAGYGPVTAPACRELTSRETHWHEHSPTQSQERSHRWFGRLVGRLTA
jgi:hypothetical protein